MNEATTAARDLPLGTRSINWLMMLVVLSQIPHYLHLPWWVSLSGTVIVLIFYLANKPQHADKLKWCNRTHVLTLLSIVAAGAVYSFYGYFLGRDPCVAFLFLLSACKFAETRKMKDASLLICLCGFLLLTQYFYSQTFLAALISLPAVLVIGGALYTLQFETYIGMHGKTPAQTTLYGRPQPSAESTRSIVGHMGRLLLQGTPIAMLLFLLFPRLPGPLWNLPDDAIAQTGLSDSLSMGSISQLSQSSAVAFRVEFDGPTPAASELYWRGPVLDTFDGRNWTMSRQDRLMADSTFRQYRPEERQMSELSQELHNSPQSSPPHGMARHHTQPELGAAAGGRSAPIRYDVTLQANNQRWLFALENALTLPQAVANSGGSNQPLALMTQDRQLIATQPVTRATRYSVWSALRSHHPGGRARSNSQTQIAGRNHKAIQFALERRAQAESDEEYAQDLLFWFSEQEFFYTLSPPILGDRPVDEFLFDKRRGFCEHYASSFTFLLRAAGIPARIVTGYQGGELNGDYMIVRQSDAHAWVEAWINNRWQRYDPTAAVAPSRIESGFAASLGASEAVPRLARRDGSWFRQSQLRWDAFNHDWQRLVIDFNRDSQSSLWSFTGLSLPSPLQLTISLLCLSLLWGAIVLRMKPAFLKRLSAEDKLWADLCQCFRRAGAQIKATEGPQAYTQRLSTQWPEYRQSLSALAEALCILRFGNPDREERRKLIGDAKIQLQGLRPQRRSNWRNS